MPKEFGQRFHRERVKLSSGGEFDFDGVSSDETIIAAISTSSGKTSSGKLAVGKLMKIRSDMLFLTMALAARRLVVLTDKTMLDVCLKERANGRIPKEIEFFHVTLPVELQRLLVAAQRDAADEVTPG